MSRSNSGALKVAGQNGSSLQACDKYAIRSLDDQASPLVEGDAQNDALVQKIVLQINTVCRRATFDFAIAVGKIVVDGFHSGDLDTWRARGKKDTSFRKLARHPDLPMSPTALYRSVAIYELSQRLGVNSSRRISTSHIRLVLPLERDVQARLLGLAEAHAWSVDRLGEEIRKLPDVPSRRLGGRKRGSNVERTMRSIHKCLEKADNLFGVADVELSRETVRSMSELAIRLRQTCERLEARFGHDPNASSGGY
jgi:hypothetical protein